MENDFSEADDESKESKDERIQPTSAFNILPNRSNRSKVEECKSHPQEGSFPWEEV